MSACQLTWDACVCLFLAGWNIIAPWADSDKWWCGEHTPLSDGMGLCTLTDKNKPCQKATGVGVPAGGLGGTRRVPHGGGSSSELLQELASVFGGGVGGHPGQPREVPDIGHTQH